MPMNSQLLQSSDYSRRGKKAKAADGQTPQSHLNYNPSPSHVCVCARMQALRRFGGREKKTGFGKEGGPAKEIIS